MRRAGEEVEGNDLFDFVAAFNDALKFNWQGDNRYGILITDGAPQGIRTNDGESSSTTTDDIEGWVRAAAQNLKDQKEYKVLLIFFWSQSWT